MEQDIWEVYRNPYKFGGSIETIGTKVFRGRQELKARDAYARVTKKLPGAEVVLLHNGSVVLRQEQA